MQKAEAPATQALKGEDNLAQSGAAEAPGELGARAATVPPSVQEAEAPVAQDAIVVHEDSLDAACQAASRSIDQLIWSGSADVAKAVTLFGPGVVVLPMYGEVSGVDERQALSYAAHPKRLSRGGLMDRVDLESKFGLLDPGRLVEELTGGRAALEKRLKAISNQELHDEVVAFQDWREKANGRLKTLERRAAWAFLGMQAGTASQAAIKKAFKKRALELHPDKGGDAERFQLLQEMKELLIVPTARELEDKGKEEKEREQEVEKAQQKEKEKKDKEESEKKDGEESDFTAFDSDSSWDVDEEFKKMFPKKKKKKKDTPKEDEAGDDLDLSCQDGKFNRDRHEAARRKIHRSFIEMWERAGKLAAEIKRMQVDGSGDALRQLRKFVDRFANLEVSKLKENDPKKAERIFRRFLEQGAEVLCAAGAVDPVATVSHVAMQLNYPLLAIAPSEDLKKRCTALLEAIKRLPKIFDKYLMPAEDAADSRSRAAKEARAQAPPMAFTFLVPDPSASTKRADGQDVPGVSEVKVELPGGACLGDLRAAALQVSGGHVFCKVAPRLFCNGRFVAGANSKLLMDVEALGSGCTVQCLPSNSIFRPSNASAKRPEAQPPPRAVPAAEAAPAAEGVAGPAPPQPSDGRPEPRPGATPVHKPSPELLSALGMAESKKGAVLIPSAAGAKNGDAKQEAEAPAAAAPEAAEQAKEEVERKAAESDGGEEDPWFDDFFTETKKAADEKLSKEREEEEARIAAEKVRREKEQAEEERRLEEERAKRKAAQQQGKDALEARLKAQKQAAEAKKKLEKEKKKLAEARAKAEEKAKAQQPELRTPAQPEQRKPAQPEQRKPAKPKEDFDIWSDAIVPAKEDTIGKSLQRRRSGWDENWEHPCAGKRKPDGSAVFCYPCDGWITVGDPFDHRGFELHCEKVGHYGWID